MDDGDRVGWQYTKTKPVSVFFFFLFSLYNNTHTHTPPIFSSLSPSSSPLFYFPIFCVLGWMAALYILQLRNDRRTKKTPDCDGCASLARRHWHWKEPGRKINDERAQATLIPFSFLSLSPFFSRCCEPKPTLLNFIFFSLFFFFFKIIFFPSSF